MKSKLLLLLILFFTQSCDLTSGLYKEILRAQDLVKNQEFSKAIETYKLILDRKPSLTIKLKVYFQLGEIYSIYQGKHKEALEYFELIIKETNDPFWQVKVLEKIGEINFQYLRDYHKAFQTYKTLAEFEPKLDKFNFYHFQLGMSYFNAKLFDQAIEVFTEVLKNRNSEFYMDSYFHIGKSYFFKKEWNKAIDVWKNYLRVERDKPAIVEAKFLMANAYETSEQLKEAYILYYSILGEYPNPEVIKNRLESIYARRIARKR